MHSVQSPHALIALTRESPLGSGELKITQSMIDRFISLSGDKQPIHSETFSTRVIVPGNLLISLIPQLLQSLFAVQQTGYCYTAKYSQIRFLRTVHANDSIRIEVTFKSARERNDKVWVTQVVSMLCGARKVVEAEIIDTYISDQGRDNRNH